MCQKPSVRVAVSHCHRQMSMPKPVRPSVATVTPSARGGPDGAEAARRVARVGRPAIRRQASVLPEGAARKALPWCGELTFRTRTRHRAPDPGTWKNPDPRRRGSRGSEGSEHACLPGDDGYATPAACPVSTSSWRYRLRRTCRLVTGRSHRPGSTWPDQARPAVLAVTHSYKPTNYLWLKPFHIADSALPGDLSLPFTRARRSPSSVRRI